MSVSAQRRDPPSLLAFIGSLVRQYRQCPELGWTQVEVLEQPHAGVLALCSSVEGSSVVTLHNLGPDPELVPLSLDRAGPGDRLVDLLEEGETELADGGRVELTLEGYGYRWLRVVGPQTRKLV